MNKKKILLIALPILTVMIIATVVAVLYFTTDIFKNNQEVFAKYFIQNGELLDILENANIDEQDTFKSSNTYTGNGDLLVSVENGTNTQEIKATTATRHDMTTGRTYSEINLKNGEADLLKVSYINSDDVYAIKCDEIMANYIGFRNSDLQTFVKNMGVTEEQIKNIPDTIDFLSLNSIGKLSEEQKQHISNTYSKVILESIAKEKFSKVGKTQISADGTSYEANGYKVTLDTETIKKILINCLNKLKEDNTTLVMISNKLSILGVPSEYTDITKMSEMINNLIVQYQNKTTNGEDIIEITVYEKNKETIKTVIDISNQEKITIDRVNKNNIQKMILTIESKNASNGGSLTGEVNTATSTSEITLQKIEADTSITNEITFIPDTNNMAQILTIQKEIGKVQNNTINNISNITMSTSSDGINIETISASYTQNIQVAAQVEEIMELKNSNTVIINNYKKEQLMPFLTNLGNKVSQVIPSKITQLGINLKTNQGGNNINTNATNSSNFTNINDSVQEIMQTIKITAIAGFSISNANGMKMENVGTTFGIIGTGMYVYKNATGGIISKVEESQEKTNNAVKDEKDMEANLQAYIDEIVGQ